MNDRTLFVAKVLVASLIISLAIKYIAPLANIPGNNFTALIAVFLPPIALGIILSQRSMRT